MVTVRELYGEDPRDLCESVAATEAAAGFLTSRANASQRNAATPRPHGGKCRTPGSTVLPRPFLGPTPNVVTMTPEAFEEKRQAVRDAQENVNEHLRRALSRKHEGSRMNSQCSNYASVSPVPGSTRAPSRFSQFSSASPEPDTRHWVDRLSASRGSNYSDTSPFLENTDIKPLAKPSPLSSRASPCMDEMWSHLASRQGCEASESDFEGVSYVRAVFPFPEPIPYGPPPRQEPNPQEESEQGMSFAAAGRRATAVRRRSSHQIQGDPPSDEGVLLFGQDVEVTKKKPRALRPRSKRYMADDPWFDQHREKANNWITECAPKPWLLEYERPLWMQRKLWDRRERKARTLMFSKMPTLPFDLWLQMQQTLASHRDKPQEQGTLAGSDSEKALLAREEKKIRNEFNKMANKRRVQISSDIVASNKSR